MDGPNTLSSADGEMLLDLEDELFAEEMINFISSQELVKRDVRGRNS